MKVKNKKIAVVSCIAAGTLTLAGASIASYATSNGYGTAKNAVMKLLENENYTADMSIRVLSDGEEIMSGSWYEKYDRNGDVKLNNTEKASEKNGANNTIQRWLQDGKYISYDSYGTKVMGDEVYSQGILDAFGGVSEEDKDKVNKYIRFAELCADTVVGDLKNNFTYVSGDENSSTYEVSLDAIQIPEVINAGISAMCSTVGMSETDDPISQMIGSDPVIENVNVKFTVDNEGRLMRGDAAVIMGGTEGKGAGHSIEVDMSLYVSDYGTTAPERVDISTLSNVEYHTKR